ncbi:MAG: YegP family protein [Clostridia bacterium]|nr:YegP family protein [Clostridia bacterium]MCR4905303.1 YegP family protein [Clostridiales bacterium]
MGKFIFKQTATGFKFDLKNDEGTTVATSEVYSTEAACKNGIESVKKCSAGEIENQTVEGYETKKHPKFEVYTDKAGEFRYRLKAVNGQIVATGGVGYKTVGEAVAVAECVKAIAAGAPVVTE